MFKRLSPHAFKEKNDIINWSGLPTDMCYLNYRMPRDVPGRRIGFALFVLMLTGVTSAFMMVVCRLLISNLTGAPAALALALGFQEPRNGTATPTTPAAPTALVAAVKKRLRPVFTPSLLMIFSQI